MKEICTSWILRDRVIRDDYLGRLVQDSLTVSIIELNDQFFVRSRQEGLSGSFTTFYTSPHEDGIVEQYSSNLHLHQGMASVEEAVALAKEFFGIRAVAGGFAVFKRPVYTYCGLMK